MKTINDDLQFDYSVYAVIFGADETLLKIELKDDFHFIKCPLRSRDSNLGTIFDTNDMGLLREYQQAVVDNNTQEVICAVKHKSYKRTLAKYSDQFYRDSDLDLISLDNQIRAIRLLKECPLRFKKIAFNLKIEDFYVGDNTRNSGTHNWIHPIGEATNTKPISIFSCTDSEIEEINRQLPLITFPLQDELLNSCHMYYDLSYHTEKYVSITLLTTALEVLFLKKNEEGKRQRLAKRCACYLYDDDQTILSTYNRLKDEYKKRSEFVHDGKASGILEEDILFLRECVRKSLLKAMSSTESKNQRIKRLKSIVDTHKSIFGE